MQINYRVSLSGLYIVFWFAESVCLSSLIYLIQSTGVLFVSLLFHLLLSLKGSIDHTALCSMLQPAPPPSLLNVVNNRNGVISVAPCEMAAQL